MNMVYLFEKIISQSKNINNLPTMSQLYEAIMIHTNGMGCDYDYEIEMMFDNWDECKITLLDGTEVELSGFGNCILHKYGEIESEYSYKIAENLYICADCLTVLTEHKELCNEYLGFHYESLLFPKRWDGNRVISWLEKSKKRQTEYYQRRIIYETYEYDYD